MTEKKPMNEFFNPVEVKIKMKRVKTPDAMYFIGNSDMQFDTKDTVLIFYPPPDGERMGGALVIKRYVPAEDDDEGNKKE